MVMRLNKIFFNLTILNTIYFKHMNAHHFVFTIPSYIVRGVEIFGEPGQWIFYRAKPIPRCFVPYFLC